MLHLPVRHRLANLTVDSVCGQQVSGHRMLLAMAGQSSLSPLYEWRRPGWTARATPQRVLGWCRRRSGRCAVRATRWEHNRPSIPMAPKEGEAVSNAGSGEQVQDVVDRLKAEVAELRRSRKRLARASDADRREIERALHDGVQQHLVAL